VVEPVITGYEDFALIGTGGFSRVYRAEQHRLKRRVAIKVLNVGLNTEAERRSFLREAETLGRVSTHPNIVSVYDTEFTSEGNPCIVMEHYPGGSLGDLIGEIGRLSVQATLEVGVSIASALAASHRAGVVHCDLKPQNILISEFGQPVLGDFGISTLAEERTRTGDGIAFTLSFAAPEIVEGASPSIETDVYSLAATLYTALAGESPFGFVTDDNKKPSTSERARRIVLEEPEPLATFGVPSEVDAVIRGAMSKDADLRPQSAADFAAQLHEVGQRLGYGTSRPRTSERGALPVLDTSLFNLNDVEFTQTGALPTASVTPDAAPAVVLGPGTGEAEPVIPAAQTRAAVPMSELAPEPATPFVDPPRKSRTALIISAALVAAIVVAAVSSAVSRQDTASPVSTPEPTVEPEPTSEPVPTSETAAPAPVPTATAAPQASATSQPGPTTAPTTAPATEAPEPTQAAIGSVADTPTIEVTQAGNGCTVAGCVLEITVAGFPPGDEVLIDVFETGAGAAAEPVWFVPLTAGVDGTNTTSQPFLYTAGTFNFEAFIDEGYPNDPLASTSISLMSE